MPYKVLDSPWIAATSSLATLAAIGNSVSIPFGMAPFWADILLTLILAAALLHWMFFLYAKAKQPANIDETSTQRRNAIVRRLGGGLLSSLTVPLILGGLIVWTLAPLIGHLRSNERWNLCATFIGSCPAGPCMQFFDSRRRSLGECLATDDDSGFLQLWSRGVADYRPAFIKDCGRADSMFLRLPPEAFNQRCDGLIRLR